MNPFCRGLEEGFHAVTVESVGRVLLSKNTEKMIKRRNLIGVEFGYATSYRIRGWKYSFDFLPRDDNGLDGVFVKLPGGYGIDLLPEILHRLGIAWGSGGLESEAGEGGLVFMSTGAAQADEYEHSGPFLVRGNW